MKLALIGSHGVGKATLSFELAARRCPLPINQQTTMRAQEWNLSTARAPVLLGGLADCSPSRSSGRRVEEPPEAERVATLPSGKGTGTETEVMPARCRRHYEAGGMPEFVPPQPEGRSNHTG
jgi:hypothetical protein